jgi:uncharacterized surface protein with fasciclin (FAS1) repeats
MTPNTLRIALGVLLLGAAPAAIASFPQQAISETQPAQAEQLAPAQAQTEPAAPAEAQAEPAESAQADMSIADIAASGEDFETLTAAIEAAGLTETLSNDDLSITVFAPTDDAFAALPEGTVEALLLPENRDQLTQLLTYHVVDGEVRSADLVSWVTKPSPLTKPTWWVPISRPATALFTLLMLCCCPCRSAVVSKYRGSRPSVTVSR